MYSLDDVSGDTSLTSFNINNAPSYLFSVINDIQGINPYLKVHLLPWSPVSTSLSHRHNSTDTHGRQPAWMKDSGNINGGNFLDQYTSSCRPFAAAH